MKRFFLLIILMLLTACGTQPDIQPELVQTIVPTAVSQATTPTETAVTQPTAVPTQQPQPTETAVAPTAEPVETTVEATAVSLTELLLPALPAGELPPLPAARPVEMMDAQGAFPAGVTLSLAADLPQEVTAVSVLANSPAAPLTPAEAAALAAQFGFAQGLSVSWWPGQTDADVAALTEFIAIDGTRLLSMNQPPYSITDASHIQPEAYLPYVPYEQAVPLATQALQELGLLTFAYQTAESSQGDGVLFYPLVDGIPAFKPAYGVNVTADGQIVTMNIWPLETLRSLGSYPTITADEAWQLLQANPNDSRVVYALFPLPASSAPIILPTIYRHLPQTDGQAVEVYNEIWVTRHLETGDLQMTSSQFHQIVADQAVLAEMAGQLNDTVVFHLWGTAQQIGARAWALALTDWEPATEFGSAGLPRFYGTIAQNGAETMIAADTGEQYLLLDAPAGLQNGDVVELTAVPHTTADGTLALNWREMFTYPPQAETAPPPPAPAIQQVTITDVKLVRRNLTAYLTGLTDDIGYPMWQFSGTADTGAPVMFWVTAVQPQYIANN